MGAVVVRVAEDAHPKVRVGKDAPWVSVSLIGESLFCPRAGRFQYEASQEGYLGMGQTARTMGGADTNKLIDAEIKGLVEGGLARARSVLSEQEDKLHLHAQALLEYETLTGEEIAALMKDGKIDRDSDRGATTGVQPVRGSAIPKAGKRFGGEGAAQGA